MSDCIPRWYALHVHSRREKAVCAQLEANQYEVFLPLYRARHKWADRWKTLLLPLFPGYVFCRFDPALRSGVVGASGVIDIVRAGREPAPVECGEIESIRRIASSRLSTEPYASMVVGQPVVLRGGPLNGLGGKLIEVRNSLRLVVSVEILLRSVAVEIDREWVVPCTPGMNPARTPKEA